MRLLQKQRGRLNDDKLQISCGVVNVKEIVRSDDINKLSQEDQLKFYKSCFEGDHCELDGCGNEVGSNWIIYDHQLYCEDCFDWKWDADTAEAVTEIEKMQKRIDELKNDYKLIL